MNEKKILCIVDSMDTGGSETMLMKIYRQIVAYNIKLDFIVLSNKNGFYDNEIIKLGGYLHDLSGIPSHNHPIRRLKAIYNFFASHNYEYVLVPTSNFYRSLYALMAKLAGVQTVAIRSTNSSTCMGEFADFVERRLQFIPRISSHIRFAPSKLAGDFLFGCNSDYYILHNGIDIGQFSYREDIRKFKRKQLGLEDKIVVGHIGRFSKQKNHKFLIDVFYEFYKQNKNTALLLIGDGELKTEIKNQVDVLGLSNYVIFLGVRQDISELFMSMDIFLFPSLYEGMPNVVIEAQATGLPCVISDSITSECKVTSLVHFQSIKGDSKIWSDDMNKILSKNVTNRECFADELKMSGYDITYVANFFIEKMGL